MERHGVLVQVSALVLLIAMIGMGAGGLYYYSAQSLSTGGTNSPGSGNMNVPTSRYLGYLPAGYQLAARLPNAPEYPCPANFNSTQCAQFKASCGNGVCDPNETCSTCPLDCGTPQGLACDPYTGRASGVGAVCELSIPFSNTQPGTYNPTLNTPSNPYAGSTAPTP